MMTINLLEKKQLDVKIPADLVEAMDGHCHATGRSRTDEVVLALTRHLNSPIDGVIGGLSNRKGKPTHCAWEIPAALADALVERSRVSLRTLRVEVRLALEKHLAGPAEPLAAKPEQMKGPKGRARKMSLAPFRD